MYRPILASFLVFAATAASAFAAQDEEWALKLQRAEERLEAVYKEVESGLSPDQKTKLQAAQDAWERYRELVLDSISTSGRVKEAIHCMLSASLAWSRVSHLNRMLTQCELIGSDSDFRDADDTINRVYQEQRRFLDHREPFEALRDAQRAWIVYRDAAAESESSVCPNPDSAALLVKTELTYERACYLRPRGFCLKERLSSRPPDLQKELFLAQLLSDNIEIRNKAISFFKANAGESISLLLAQLKIDMLPANAYPIFEELGSTAIPFLLELTDNSSWEDDTLPVFLAATGSGVVPELVQRISSTNPATSRICMSALERLGAEGEEAVPVLMDIIKKPDGESEEWAWRRGAAVKTVLRIAPDNPEIVEAIVDAYIASPTDNQTFIEALRTFGPAAKEALPILIEKARASEGYNGAGFAVEWIISPEDTELIPSLMEGLIDPDTYYWDCFGRALVKMNASTAPLLTKLLQSNDDQTVWRAAATLATLKNPSDDVIAALIPLLNKEDSTEAVFFIDLVARFRESAKDAVPVLLNLYRSNKGGVSAAAAHALQAIAPDMEEAKGIVLPEPFVTDPYYDAGCFQVEEEPGMGPPYVLIADFNNDGSEDIAIATGGFGTGGGGWTLYLGVAERKYKNLGGFGAPRRVTLFTKEKDVGYMGAYWHSSAATGTEFLYRVTMDELTEVESVAVEWDSSYKEVPVDRNETLPIPEGHAKTVVSGRPVDKEFLNSL